MAHSNAPEAQRPDSLLQHGQGGTNCGEGNLTYCCTPPMPTNGVGSRFGSDPCSLLVVASRDILPCADKFRLSAPCKQSIGWPHHRERIIVPVELEIAEKT